MRRSPLALALYTLVLVAIVGTTTAFVRLDKTVTVRIDGVSRQVHTFASTVGSVLDRAGIPVHQHDVLVPDPAAPISNHGVIIIDRGRPVDLSLDGRVRQVWVTAMTVDDALAELGLRVGGMYVSASRSRSIPLSGFALTIRLPQRVSVLVDGHVRVAETTAANVKTLLHQLHIKVARTDRVSVPLGYYPTTGLVVRITRIRYGQMSVDEPIPFQTIDRNDSSLWVGQTSTAQYGTPGVRVLLYDVTYRNGALVAQRLVSSHVASQPTEEIIDVGTYQPPVSKLNWTALAYCESGDDPYSVSADGQYFGLYQFTLGTWYSVGGSGYPNQASAAEQTYRAELLYEADGTGPWPVCGHDLYS